MSASSGESPQQHIGSYLLLGKIGAGAMGVVFRAQHTATRQMAAIKVFKPARFTKQLLQRFHTEVDSLSRLRHPGICRILEVGTASTTEGPAPYLVMEFVEGQTLAAHALQRNFTVKQRVQQLLIKLCDAVEHAHAKGVIHRDLKPANILVTHDGQPKILDFGIARAIDADPVYAPPDAKPATLVGTLAYMSPEQAAREVDRLDARSDVYSLGVIGYELLSGKLPYELRNKSVSQILQVIRAHPPRPLGEVEPQAAGDLEHIFEKALQKAPQDRYESALALADDLQRYAQGQPTSARRPRILSALDRVAKQTREAVDAVGDRVRGALHRDHSAAPSPSPSPAPPPPSPADAPSHAGPVRAHTWPQRVREGVNQMRGGDCTMALLWFVAALQKCAGDASAESMLRTRVGLMLQQSPRLIDVDPLGAPPPAWLAPPDRTLEIGNDPRGNAFLVRLIDADTSRTLLGPLWHHTSVVQADFAQDGSAVVTKCRDETLRVWSAATQQPLVMLTQHKDAVTSAAFAPAGDILVTGDASGRAFVVRRGAGVVPLEGGHDGAIRHAAFSHDGGLLATGGDDKTVRVWETGSGRAVSNPIINDQPVVEVRFIREGKQVMVAMSDGGARVWEVSTGKPMTPTLASGTQVYRALMREARAQVPIELSPHRSGVELAPALAKFASSVSGGASGAHTMFSKDARFAITLSARGEALLWELASALPLSAPLDPEQRATAVAIGPEGSLALVGSIDGSARLLSLAPDGRPLEDLTMISEALSCHLVDDALGLYPLSAPDWRAAWLRAAPALRISPRA
jgi:serine/threonine protein kinase/WD40 repeat protein